MAAELQALINTWQARRYSLDVQYRIASRHKEPTAENLKQELERCEKWLDALAAELAELAGVRAEATG
jgi:gamma-glutamyl:cysteine ligase YbdK (ATP-grasp superfamily)